MQKLNSWNLYCLGDPHPIKSMFLDNHTLSLHQLPAAIVCIVSRYRIVTIPSTSNLTHVPAINATSNVKLWSVRRLALQACKSICFGQKTGIEQAKSTQKSLPPPLHYLPNLVWRHHLTCRDRIQNQKFWLCRLQNNCCGHLIFFFFWRSLNIFHNSAIMRVKHYFVMSVCVASSFM